MNDTAPEVAAMIAARYAATTGAERLRLAAEMFDAARTLVLASAPGDASPHTRRRLLLERFYPELAARIAV